jgi:hypothetical protein
MPAHLAWPTSPAAGTGTRPISIHFNAPKPHGVAIAGAPLLEIKVAGGSAWRLGVGTSRSPLLRPEKGGVIIEVLAFQNRNWTYMVVHVRSDHGVLYRIQFVPSLQCSRGAAQVRQQGVTPGVSNMPLRVYMACNRATYSASAVSTSIGSCRVNGSPASLDPLPAPSPPR